jgi:hypothetical protein
MAEVLAVLRSVLGAGAFTDRKTRLLTCGCARLKWDLLTDLCSRKAVEAAERYADGSLGLSQMLKRHRAARDASYRSPANQTSGEAKLVAHAAAECARTHVNLFHARLAAGDALGCILAREIFGNPFRPVTLQPAWLTSDVVALARSINDERAFDRMPILADALDEAGCEDRQLLGHCRGTGPHVRGCWAIDLLFAKE